ncbi:hypothetical protein CSAL01_04862 [Colletotrichum salicis]|uniref:Uncharacterized protein n=1 Tax=Colletotrichum salicis TaxID=1209931 RepID=A0A135V663_9PEZI|nr:hypothetical protein CSAL01_04862 [Colletotrichum salicis]
MDSRVPNSMHTVGDWTILKVIGRPGSLPMLHTVTIRTLEAPVVSQQWSSGLLQALCQVAPNIVSLDAELAIPMAPSMDLEDAIFQLRNVRHLDLYATGIGSKMLSSLAQSCGPLRSFRYRPAAWNVNWSHLRTRVTADITVEAILDALRPHANTLESLELEILENAFCSGRQQQLESMREFQALKHLALDSFCYDENQSLGNILMQATDHRDHVLAWINA